MNDPSREAVNDEMMNECSLYAMPRPDHARHNKNWVLETGCEFILSDRDFQIHGQILR